MIIGITATLTQTLSAHDHQLHEFIVCLNDAGELRAAEQGFPYKTGCSLFIPGGVSHSIVASEKAPAASSFTCFDWYSCNEHLHDSLKPLVKRLSKSVSAAYNYDQTAINRNLELAERLAAELQKQDAYSESMAGSILTQLLVNHIRDLGFRTEGDKSSTEQKIAKSIEWIKNNLNAEITLDDMAKSVCMSRSLYASNFRAYAGTSLIAFTMAARTESAAQLLSQTDDPIANIATTCGFNNIGYFHRTFKQRFRMTPKQYRQTARKQGSTVTSRPRGC